LTVPEVCLLITSVADVENYTAEFRVCLALSILAGVMPPDSETIALYPADDQGRVSLSSKPNCLSFVTIAVWYRQCQSRRLLELAARLGGDSRPR
jgi:hypothetical protein